MEGHIGSSARMKISLCARALGLLPPIIALLCLVSTDVGVAGPDVEYHLGHEDVIQVTVMGHAELSGEFYVPSDGLLSIPRVGQISVTGKTVQEVSQMIATGMRTFLRSPDVSVILKTPRPQMVYVTGAVNKPGSYDLKPGWRISEAIGAAGGITSGIANADCTVTILHGTGGAKDTVSLPDVLQGGQSKDLLLQTGDLVTVESAEAIPIYVMGKVVRPGLYSIRKDSAGILEAITVAGGTLDDAALTKVTVTHLTGDTETVNIVPATLQGKQQSSIKLRSGDLVVVPESLARFAVLGWVNTPGFFPLKENQRISLSEAIGMAGGMEKQRGGIEKVALLRTVDGKQQRTVYDLGRFLKQGDLSQNPAIMPGDIVYVPETRKLDWSKVFSGISAAFSMLWTVDRISSSN